MVYTRTILYAYLCPCPIGLTDHAMSINLGTQQFCRYMWSRSQVPHWWICCDGHTVLAWRWSCCDLDIHCWDTYHDTFVLHMVIMQESDVPQVLIIANYVTIQVLFNSQGYMVSSLLRFGHINISNDGVHPLPWSRMACWLHPLTNERKSNIKAFSLCKLLELRLIFSTRD